MTLTPPSLRTVVTDPTARTAVAADAVQEAEAALRERGGLRAIAARVGFDTIQRVRPGFLERQIDALLPQLATAIEPHWEAGLTTGDPEAHLAAHADEVTAALLGVTDQHVARAADGKAIAVYEHLRPHAPQRISEQMPRIAAFVERHTATAEN